MSDPFSAALASRDTSGADPFAAALGARSPGRRTAPATGGDMSLADVGHGAIENFPASARQFGEDIVRPFTEPVETAKALGNLAVGAGQKLIPGEQGSERHADAVGRFFADRYGGWEEVKRTMASDPVGFLADAATVLTGGAAAAARAPGVAGTMARAVGTAGRALDPVSLATKAASVVGKPLGTAGAHVLGMTTGAKAEAVKTAARTGYQGGNMAETFRGAMRGDIPVERVVEEARGALAEMYRRRSAQYEADIGSTRAATEPLSFDGIDAALDKAGSIKVYKGRDLSPSTAKIRAQIRETVDEWRKLDPAEYHTPAGMDALKQVVGDIAQGAEYGSPARKVADGAYNAIKREIQKQVPEYAKAMKNYTDASEALRTIERELSLGKKASTGTALRKLQAIIRNDVSSAYGHRGNLAETLADAGAEGIVEQLSGQALGSYTPRGLSGSAAGVGATVGAFANPAMIAAAPFTSPRLVGEAVHAGGRAARRVGSAVPSVARRAGRPATGAAFQAGRAADAAGAPVQALPAPAAEPAPAESFDIAAMVPGARQAPDGEWYAPDPDRPGKWARVRVRE